MRACKALLSQPLPIFNRLLNGRNHLISPKAANYGTTSVYSSSGQGDDFDSIKNSNAASTYRAMTPVPCVTYWIGNTLYIALTNRCNTVSLHTTRGPGFGLAGRLSKAGFLPLAYDPSAEEIMSGVEGALSASHASFKPSQEVVFSGWGEPTLRWETTLTLAEGIRMAYKNVKLRLATNGLGNVANQRSILPDVAGVFHSATIALNTANATQYDEIMKPDLRMRGESQVLRPTSSYYTSSTVPPLQSQRALDLATAFTKESVEHGLKTEVTAVARPDVDISSVGELAKRLGADFRVRPYFQ